MTLFMILKSIKLLVINFGLIKIVKTTKLFTKLVLHDFNGTDGKQNTSKNIISSVLIICV